MEKSIDIGIDTSIDSRGAASINEDADEIAELKSKFAYLAADFDNFKKRAQKDKLSIIESANDALIADILPVIDNFENAQAAIDASPQEIGKSFSTGIKVIMSGLTSVLNQHGYEKVKIRPGDKFDVSTCEAIMSEESDLEPGLVTRVISSGWTNGSRLVRVAKVAVSR